MSKTVTYLGPSGGRLFLRCGVDAMRDVPVSVPDDYAAELAGNAVFDVASPAMIPGPSAAKVHDDD